MNQIGTGQIMNLLSNDVTRFDQLTTFLNFIWIMPLQVIIPLVKSMSFENIPSLLTTAIVPFLKLLKSINFS